MNKIVNKYIVFRTGSLSGTVLDAPTAKSPEKFFAVKIVDDDQTFYYNKEGFLSTDIDDATFFEECTALQVLNSLKSNYRDIRVFGTTYKGNNQPIIKEISECILAISSRKWCS